jgi:hypothetical protein
MSKIVKADFDGSLMSFTAEAWFNATEAAAHFGKEPGDWLREREAVEYLAVQAAYQGNSGFVEELNSINALPSTSAASQAKLLKLSKQSGYVRTKAGSPVNGGGTWLHPKLAVRFTQWLAVRFAIWYDRQIRGIVSGHAGVDDWHTARIKAASRFRGVCDMLNLSRQADGKTTARHHYSNEALLINEALTGQRTKLDRNSLSRLDLRLLELLETQDMLLLARGAPFDERKKALHTFAPAPCRKRYKRKTDSMSRLCRLCLAMWPYLANATDLILAKRTTDSPANMAWVSRHWDDLIMTGITCCLPVNVLRCGDTLCNKCAGQCRAMPQRDNASVPFNSGTGFGEG